MARRAQMPDFLAWEQKIRATGGCANPIRMRGGRVIVDRQTGEVLDAFHTDDDPLGYGLIACGNRRKSVCPSCSRIHSRDTYQLVKAGLAGGKGVPESVQQHPAIFATLTAPSFGPVHTVHRNNGRDGEPLRCRVRRDRPVCAHGVVMACSVRHDKGEDVVGEALCLDCYDYTGAVLFNAYAGELWRRVTIYLRRELAALVGVSARQLSKLARVSFGKVAEFQARGVVHFHTVIRLDGTDGPVDAPPLWASAELLAISLTRAVRAVRIEVPAGSDRTIKLAFGDQLDIKPIAEESDARAQGVTRRHVAAYLAKYVTKGAEATGTSPKRIKPRDLDWLRVPQQAELMIRKCFALAREPACAELRLAQWAHMLGYRGHVATKSRTFSATYGQLRADRKAHQEARRREAAGLEPLGDRPVIVAKQWKFLRSGLAYGERGFVDAVRHRQQIADKVHRSTSPDGYTDVE